MKNRSTNYFFVLLNSIGSHRLVFEPYGRQQIERIISERLSDVDLFEREAVEFCARKISSLSGDMRQALGICSFSLYLHFVIFFLFYSLFNKKHT